MKYMIHATVSRTVNGAEKVVTTPTFFLDSTVQGIVDADHAEYVAKSMLDPFGESVVCAFAYPVPEDGVLDLTIDRAAVKENLTR